MSLASTLRSPGSLPGADAVRERPTAVGETLGPRVDAAREALTPRITAAVEAAAAAGGPTRDEAVRRSRSVIEALRGETPAARRRWPSGLIFLLVGIGIGAVLFSVGRRFITPVRDTTGLADGGMNDSTNLTVIELPDDTARSPEDEYRD